MQLQTKLTLNPMTPEDFAKWAPRSRDAYALEKAKANGLTKEESEKVALEDFARILPNGFASKDNYLYLAFDQDGKNVGYLWFCVRGPDNNRRAFVCDILIEPEFRGQGCGRELMKLLEVEVRNLSLKRIGLHVFSNNLAAVRLYESLGFKTTDLSMEKYL
jgi:ribosomal protein S18 acetylase RimI-like enzyme